jgi:hypothetical protein
VKWKELTYEECTWENESDISAFQPQIQRFNEIRSRHKKFCGKSATRESRHFKESPTLEVECEVDGDRRNRYVNDTRHSRVHTHSNKPHTMSFENDEYQTLYSEMENVHLLLLSISTPTLFPWP